MSIDQHYPVSAVKLPEVIECRHICVHEIRQVGRLYAGTCSGNVSQQQDYSSPFIYSTTWCFTASADVDRILLEECLISTWLIVEALWPLYPIFQEDT